MRLRLAALLCVLTGLIGCRAAHENLNAVLWMQTSAEYQMICESAYGRATEALDRALADGKWTAAPEQTGAQPLPAKTAVVLDLDETVLDNSPFEGALVLGSADFSEQRWLEWSQRGAARLIPGSAEFIRAAAAKSVEIFYITGRSTAEKAATKKNLAGLPVSDETLLCKGEQGKSKSEQRAYVARTHRILLLVGDDLGDFIDGSTAAPEQRRLVAGKYRDWWGERWIVLPNPCYGSWERALNPRHLKGRELLDAKLAEVKGDK